MDTTVRGIGAIVVGELRAAEYMESTIGNYEKTIRVLAGFVERRGGLYTPLLGSEVRLDDDQPAYGPVQRPAQVRLPATCQRVRRFCEHRSGGPFGP